MRTTNKIVIERVRAHILENFEPETYGNDEPAVINLVDQMDAMRYGNRTLYQIGLDYVEGGSLLVYYDSCRRFLRNVLEQTEIESQRFSDNEVWRLYCHLIAREMSKMYEEVQAMSLHLDFEPHSWYMGFAIKKDNNPVTHTWGGYTANGMNYTLVQIEAVTLKSLKRAIQKHHLLHHDGYGERIAKRRLEHLRGEIEAERISLGEIAELESLSSYIDESDIELLEWAEVGEK